MSEPMPGGPAATSDLLAGTRWRITAIDGTPAVSGDSLAVDFGHDGRVSGSTGVNRFTASYSVTAEYLTFGPMATTRRMGPPELVEQEGRVVQSLAGMCSWGFEGTALVIDGPLGRVQLASTLPAPVPTSPTGFEAPAEELEP